MKANYRIIGLLALLGLLAALLSLPYIYGLLGDVLVESRLELGLSEIVFNGILIVQAATIYAIAALIGGLIYRKAGFRLPLLESALGDEDKTVDLKSWSLWSAGTGVALAAVVIVGDYLFYRLGSPLSFVETELPAWWTGLLAAFSAGIGEELLMRFFLMTLLTLMFLNLLRMPRTAAVWSAIILVALVFGALHLPATAELVELTPIIIVRAMLLNGIAGVAFGLLYWKLGLESAMVAHILTDVIVHGLVPLFV